MAATDTSGISFEVVYDEGWQKHQENETSAQKPQGGSVLHHGVIRKGSRLVRVILLNGCSVDFLVERDFYCQDLFCQVMSYLNLWEHYVFGLAIIKDQQEIFLDLNCKLAKYAPSNWTTKSPSVSPTYDSFNVYFRVKYYVENVVHLKYPQTRHQYYLQLRKHLLEGKVYCHKETALKLAAFALQAEKGDCATSERCRDYFRPEDYLSEKVIAKLSHQYILDHLSSMHGEQLGRSREDAELDFLKEAQKLPEYGKLFYHVKDKHGAEGMVCLGFCVQGIVVYSVHEDVKTQLHHCPWQKIKDVCCANRKLKVKMEDSKCLKFYTSSNKSAEYLLDLSISYNYFQQYTQGLLSQGLKGSGAELKELINELQGVTDWFLLGLCLGVPESKLEEIKQDHRQNSDRRKEMLITWKHAEIETTWEKVVDALLEMGARVHALYIAAKHGVALPQSAKEVLFQGRQGQDDRPHLEGEEQVMVTNAPKPQLGLRDLLKELQSVTDWRKLGLHLDVPEPKLDDIQESNSGSTDDCRREMFMAWMDLEVPTWARVVHALIHIGLPVLAAEIARNHGEPIPKSVIEKIQPEQRADFGTDATPDETAIEHPDTQLKEVPMTELLTELQRVTDWFTLGVFLEVPTPVLKAIVKDYTDTDQCRLEVLIAWSNQETPTWPRVISALGEMGMTELALGIASKYGVPVPRSLNEALERKAQSARMVESQATQAGKHDREPSQNGTGDKCPKEEEVLTVPEYRLGDMSLRQLVDELQEVVEWMPCGLYLGVAVATLKQIQKNHQTTPLCKQEMLYTWMRERRPTWLKVVEALVHIKMFHLAVKIASKYGVGVSRSLFREMEGAISQGELQGYHLKVEGRSDELDGMAEQQATNTGLVHLKDLVNEVEGVTDWFRLGMCLRVPVPVLKIIEQDIKTTSDCRKEMLIAWIKRELPTWSTVVKALLDMGMIYLAVGIVSKKYFDDGPPGDVLFLDVTRLSRPIYHQ